MNISKTICAISFSTAALCANAAEDQTPVKLKEADYTKCFPTSEAASVVDEYEMNGHSGDWSSSLHEYKTGDSGITIYIYDFPGSPNSCIVGAGVRDTDPVQMKKFHDLKLDQLTKPPRP
jgi:hypothetical protein